MLDCTITNHSHLERALPPAHSVWSKKQQQDWLELAASILAMLYTESEEQSGAVRHMMLTSVGTPRNGTSSSCSPAPLPLYHERESGRKCVESVSVQQRSGRKTPLQALIPGR